MPAGAGISRGLWAFRASFALVAVGLLAFIAFPSALRRDPADPPPPAAVRGKTGQQQPITLLFDRPGHVAQLHTRVIGRCTNPARPGHWTWWWLWTARDPGRATFRRDGRSLSAVEVTDRVFADGVFGQVVASMGATIAPGRDEARGWVRMAATFFYAGSPTTCDSGRVPFAVGVATSGRPS